MKKGEKNHSIMVALMHFYTNITQHFILDKISTAWGDFQEYAQHFFLTHVIDLKKMKIKMKILSTEEEIYEERQGVHPKWNKGI